MSWKEETRRLREAQAAAPEGCQSIEEIAEEIGMNEETAKRIVSELVKSGRAERVPGKKLTASGNLVVTNYYRLLGSSAPTVKPSARRKR